MAETRALLEALRAEVPGTEFDDAVLQHFASALEGCDDDAEVADAWVPILVSTSAASDDAAAGRVCLAVLQRLRGRASDTGAASEASKVITHEELLEWLTRLKLHKYEKEALQWCHEHSVPSVAAILEQCKPFSEHLQLKRLEIGRLQKDAEKDSNEKAVTATNMPPAHAVMLRDRIGTFGEPPYSIMEKKGSGATADVHRCLRIEDGDLKEYAVKIVGLRQYKMLNNFEEIISKLKREISILFALNHHNIVRLLDIYDEESECHKGNGLYKDKLYLVMEYVNGGDLFDYILSNGCQTESSAANMFMQLVHGLSYVHQRNIVHRDLKPENILVAMPEPATVIHTLHVSVAESGLHLSITNVSGKEICALDMEPDSIFGELQAKLAHHGRPRLTLPNAVDLIRLKPTFPIKDLLELNSSTIAAYEGSMWLDGPQLKITDFGHSKLIDDGYSVALTKVGTQQYWAPEISDDTARKNGVTQTVDLWSLGVVLFVMLTGSYPFDADDRMMAQKIQKGIFHFKEDRSPSKEAQDLIKKLIRPNPKERLALEECLRHPWVVKMCGNASDGIARLRDSDEEAIALPADPKDVKRFRADLSGFTAKFKVAATLRNRREVVVNWKSASQASVEAARSELMNLLGSHFPGFASGDGPEVQPGDVSSGGYPALASNSTQAFPALAQASKKGQGKGTPLASVLEEKSSKQNGQKPFEVKLRVTDAGAGLDLVEETGGMRVDKVLPTPGQPGLEASDLIIEIAGKTLGPTPDKVREQFQANFCNGVCVKVKRGVPPEVAK